MGTLPFQYSSRSEKVTVTSYYEVPAEVMEDPDMLSYWAVRAHAAAPKPRRGAAKQALPRNVRDSA